MAITVRPPQHDAHIRRDGDATERRSGSCLSLLELQLEEVECIRIAPQLRGQEYGVSHKHGVTAAPCRSEIMSPEWATCCSSPQREMPDGRRLSRTSSQGTGAVSVGEGIHEVPYRTGRHVRVDDEPSRSTRRAVIPAGPSNGLASNWSVPCPDGMILVSQTRSLRGGDKQQRSRHFGIAAIGELHNHGPCLTEANRRRRGYFGVQIWPFSCDDR